MTDHLNSNQYQKGRGQLSIPSHNTHTASIVETRPSIKTTPRLSLGLDMAPLLLQAEEVLRFRHEGKSFVASPRELTACTNAPVCEHLKPRHRSLTGNPEGLAIRLPTSACLLAQAYCCFLIGRTT